MSQKKIVYAAANGSLGETGPWDCEAYRDWAKSEIRANHSDYDVVVSDDETLLESSVYGAESEDEKEEILEDLKGLWDRCPWDWD